MSTTSGRRNDGGRIDQEIPDCRGIGFLSLPHLALFLAKENGTEPDSELRQLCINAHFWLTIDKEYRDAYRKTEDDKYLVVSATETDEIIRTLRDIGIGQAELDASTKPVLSSVDVMRQEFRNYCTRRARPLPRFWFSEAVNRSSENDDKQSSMTLAAGTDDPLDIFRAMDRLADEITIRFVPENLVEIAARGEHRRVTPADFCLWAISQGYDVPDSWKVASPPEPTSPATANPPAVLEGMNQSDLSLGQHMRARNQDFARRNKESAEARQQEWDRWKAKAAEIQAARKRPYSKRALAALVKDELNLTDSVETIRRRI